MTAGDKARLGKEAAALALHRFGFGPAGDSIAAIAADPRGALLADLDRPGAGCACRSICHRAAQRRARFSIFAPNSTRSKSSRNAPAKRPRPTAMAPAMSDAGQCRDIACPAAESRRTSRRRCRSSSSRTRPRRASMPPSRPISALSSGWCGSGRTISAFPPTRSSSMAGPYEREAIRPHVLGRFADLLLAVESHPAHAVLSRQRRSRWAPNSIAGINRDKGLNENLARETLELHTLGVRSGYTQADVTSFANVLTGWTWINPEEPERGGEFIFIKRLHEPGDQIVLGKRYPDTGVDQGRAVLADLARHPATAQHIAREARASFRGRRAAARAGRQACKDVSRTATAISKKSPRRWSRRTKSWTPQRQKLKTPAEWVAGVIRLTGAQADDPDRPHHECASRARRAVVAAAGAERLSRHRSGLDRRRAAPHRYRQRFRRPRAGTPIRWRCSTAGSVRSPRPIRAQTVARAGSRNQAIALLVMTPEFLRR